MRLLFSIIVFCILSFLSSCGFQPVNDTAFNNRSKKNIPPISLPQPQTKSEFHLKNELQYLLPGDQGDYQLVFVQYTNNITGNVLDLNNHYTRYNIQYTLLWQLRNSQGQILKSGNSGTVVGINISKTGYPTVSAQQDVDKQAAKIIAQDVYSRLRAYFKQP